MNFQKKVSKSNYVRECIVVLNGLLGLTPREIDILTSMIKIDSSWTPRSSFEVKDILATDARRLVMKENNMNKSNFTKIVNKLISIGLLVLSENGKYVVNDLLKPIVNSKNRVEITFVLDIVDVIQ